MKFIKGENRWQIPKKLANMVQQNSLKGDLEYLFKGVDMRAISGGSQEIIVGLDKMLGNHAAVKTRLVAS